MTFSPGFPSAHPGQLDRKAHRSPLHRHTCDASTPARGATPASAPGGPLPKSRSALVVSHHLGGFLRIAGRGLVASRSRSWGSRRLGARAADRRSGRRAGFLAAQDSYPSKECACDSRTASPRPLPPCRWSLRAADARAAPLLGWRLRRRWAQDLDFEALLRHRVPVGSRAVADADRTGPSWASFPFKVLRDGRRFPLPPSHRSPDTSEEGAEDRKAPLVTRRRPRPKPGASGPRRAANRAAGMPCPWRAGTWGPCRRARRRKAGHSVDRRPKPPEHTSNRGRERLRASGGTRSGGDPFDDSSRGECTAEAVRGPKPPGRAGWQERGRTRDRRPPMPSKSIRS